MKVNNNGSKKIPGVIYILGALVVILFLARGAVKYFNQQINELVYPIQSKIYMFGKNIQQRIDGIENYQKVFEENTQLKEKINERDMLAEENDILKQENRRLRELLGMKEEFKYNFKIGKVSFHQVRELYESFSISLGEKDGIKKNMVVLSGKNLIGKVDKVMENYSVVQMITGQDVIVSVLLDNTLLGVVRGDRNGELFFEPSSIYEAELKKGDKVYTSGVSDIYPKGIYVGHISDIDEQEKNPMKKYKVKSDVDIFDLNEIIVITGDDKLWQ